jgi:hypothetical protein
MSQAIALKPGGIAVFADAASLQRQIKSGVVRGGLALRAH